MASAGYVHAMCSDKVIEFGARVLSADDVAGKDVIEVGSRVVQDPSMTLRHHVESLEPRSYWGIERARQRVNRVLRRA